MKTLEQLGYKKVKENQEKIVYESIVVESISIRIDKKTKEVFKDCYVNGYSIAQWMNMDELKAVLAILEESK